MEDKTVTAAEIEGLLVAQRDDAQREVLMRFFKTGPGQYGEGDEFLGLKVPQTRAVVKEVRRQLADEEIVKLLYSPLHEVRLCGLLLMVEEMKTAVPTRRGKDDAAKSVRRDAIARLYLKHARQANNWDLVDLSCQYILGPWIRLSDRPDYGVLMQLAESDNLWEQRIAVVTTLDFVRQGILGPSLALADKLIGHRHDLIHKAVGWILREVGKRDTDTLRDYLDRQYALLPRTTLRYAIERLPERERKSWLSRKR